MLCIVAIVVVHSHSNTCYVLLTVPMYTTFSSKESDLIAIIDCTHVDQTQLPLDMVYQVVVRTPQTCYQTVELKHVVRVLIIPNYKEVRIFNINMLSVLCFDETTFFRVLFAGSRS